MNFLLDTNVVFELRKAEDGKANPEVIGWLSSIDAEISSCPPPRCWSWKLESSALSGATQPREQAF